VSPSQQKFRAGPLLHILSLRSVHHSTELTQVCSRPPVSRAYLHVNTLRADHTTKIMTYPFVLTHVASYEFYCLPTTTWIAQSPNHDLPGTDVQIVQDSLPTPKCCLTNQENLVSSSTFSQNVTYYILRLALPTLPLGELYFGQAYADYEPNC
jgi:hypothetical protein